MFKRRISAKQAGEIREGIRIARRDMALRQITPFTGLHTLTQRAMVRTVEKTLGSLLLGHLNRMEALFNVIDEKIENGEFNQ